VVVTGRWYGANLPERGRYAGGRGTANPMYRIGRMVRCQRSISHSRRNNAIPSKTRAAAVEDVISGYEALMQRLADSHAPEFLEIPVTMPQAKLLYLLGASGELHMSELVTRLGVSLSTISGLVDRVVDHGLVTRREDPADRRQVLVGLTAEGSHFIDRFRELNAGQMRALLALLDDEELEQVRVGLTALSHAATRRAPAPPRAARAQTASRTPARKDPA
jgi:DNA-binding MarR family transcriptional regulator